MTSSSKSVSKSAGNVGPDSLWIEKHAPQTLEEIVVNKKKVKEFIEVVEENGGGGILILHGPPGSCKNALINAYSASRGVQLVRFHDTKTQHLDDLYGKTRAIEGVQKSAQYPDDLENLIAFIRKQGCGAVNARAKPSLSAFSQKRVGAFVASQARVSPSSTTQDFELTKSQESRLVPT